MLTGTAGGGPADCAFWDWHAPVRKTEHNMSEMIQDWNTMYWSYFIAPGLRLQIQTRQGEYC